MKIIAPYNSKFLAVNNKKKIAWIMDEAIGKMTLSEYVTKIGIPDDYTVKFISNSNGVSRIVQSHCIDTIIYKNML